MPNIPQLQPDNQFPTDAIKRTVQEFPPAQNNFDGGYILVFNIASVADAITPWGKNTGERDRQLREFWPTEPNLAGAMANMCERNAAFDWVIKGPSQRLETVITDMLKSALGPPGQVGWAAKEIAVSQDFYGTDNGAFEEIIRDPGMDANSKFKNEKAPVVGVAHLDSNKCIRTGNPEYPVLYTDRHGKLHKMAWYQVIPFCEMPSPITSMNGVGICAVTRILRAAQIIKSIEILTDEMVSGRNFRKINIVGGVGRTDVEDARRRASEQADNAGYTRFIEHIVLCGLDPEKPVSVASFDLASLPTDFNYDIYMKWYISTLALGFVVDYQDFAPLPGGNIGSSAQSEILSQKSRAKGPATYMRAKVEAYKTYGVLPRNCEIVYDDQDQAEALEEQEVRTKAMEEYAIATRSFILPPAAARKDALKRGIYAADILDGIPENYGEEQLAPKQNVGQTGGNTLAEDASRTPKGKPDNTVGDRLQKELKIENEDRESERRGFLEIVKAISRPRVVEKAVTPPEIKVDVHNHPGKPPVVNVTPHLHADLTARIIQPVQKEKTDNGLAAAFMRLAKALSSQKAPEVRVENTVNIPEQKPPQITVNSPVTVNVPKGKPSSVEIEYDGNGKPIGLKPN